MSDPGSVAVRLAPWWGLVVVPSVFLGGLSLAYAVVSLACRSGSHALVLESNYCPERLTYSPYPEQVRQRIRGRHGHLSNHDMASLLHALLHDALRTVVLIHISENNNAPGLARSLAEGVLRGHKAELHLAEHDAPTPMFEIVA